MVAVVDGQTILRLLLDSAESFEGVVEEPIGVGASAAL